MGKLTLAGRVISPGRASGLALVSSEPISFWGGFDARTGEIIDRRHPLSGQNARGKILAVPYARGSSTTTAVLLEAIRAGTAPSAIITTGRDVFFALAAVVADELYAQPLPLVEVSQADFARMKTGDEVEVEGDGNITISRAATSTIQR